ncbi:hypothetical protein FQR65_LT03678 [Abscondita terminalis]|nr:hypothetical protein FQR65_LT03678 [Abscondita terminalis]
MQVLTERSRKWGKYTRKTEILITKRNIMTKSGMEVLKIEIRQSVCENLRLLLLTGTLSVPKENVKRLAPKGIKQFGIVALGERDNNCNCLMDACGLYIPILFIFPRIRVSLLLGKNELFYMLEQHFLQGLQHFTKKVEDNLVLLILDRFCRQNFIVKQNEVCESGQYGIGAFGGEDGSIKTAVASLVQKDYICDFCK